MKKVFFHTIIICFALGLCTSCSTQKNTWAARNYHALTTKYNVKFNGEESYKAGLKQIEQARGEDYSELLPIYPISNHKLAAQGTGKMNTCIKKCESAVKTHSIRVKPEKKPAKNAPLKDKLFYEQEEFNPVMGSVFLLMAKAQFHKADFMSAIATCSYVIRHFPQEKALCDEAKIWQARAYEESDWMYEAENIFVKMNEEGYDRDLTDFYSVAYADFLIKREDYHDAIPLLEIGLSNTRKKYDKQRYTFILAQLYQLTGNHRKAYELYRAVARMNPPYEMDLNARIRQSEVYEEGGVKSTLRKLKRLGRNPNNVDYLDAIFYAMGNIYLSTGDTVNAVESYQTAINKSTKNGPYKAQALMSLGAYYYNEEDFMPAEPCYSEAKSILKEEHEDREMVVERARVLGLLYPYLETVHVQDSLQAVAAMPDERRMDLIDSMITEAKKKAKEEARLKNQEEALSQNAELTKENDKSNEVIQPNLMPGNDNSWYFYNENSKTAGKKEFERTWGRRKLEDNWRIKNKGDFFTELSHPASGEDGVVAADVLQSDLSADSSMMADTMAVAEEKISAGPVDFEPSDDPTEIGYYLKDLPFTEDQLQASNEMICEAIFESGMIYREEMGNDDLALRTFARLEERFPEDTAYLPEAYYISYLLLRQHGQEEKAETTRQQLLTIYPDSKQAGVLSDSLFLEKLTVMYQVQNTLYRETYQYFMDGQSDSVKINCQYVEDNYQRSSLRPKFMFLRALEAVKDGDPDLFLSLISAIVKDYPESELASVSSQMLGYWNEGRRPVGFSGFYLESGKSIEDSIAQANLKALAEQFTYQPDEVHVLALGFSADSINVNRLLFDVALYNFTNFLIRDYELSVEKIGPQDVLMIRSFENAEDVMRYASWMNFQNEVPQIKYPGLKFFILSESNLNLLNEKGQFPEDAYQLFFEENYR